MKKRSQIDPSRISMLDQSEYIHRGPARKPTPTEARIIATVAAPGGASLERLKELITLYHMSPDRLERLCGLSLDFEDRQALYKHTRNMIGMRS